MSSLFRKSAVIVAAAFSARAMAAGSGYIVPEAELDAVNHSNPELAQAATKSSASGYLGVVGGTFGFGSERYLTELRPKIQYESYSSRRNLRHVNQYLDLSSHYETLRSDWQLYGNYSRENSYAAQRPSALYDTFNPTDQTLDASGRISAVSETYTRVQLQPSFTHSFTQRFGTRLSASYQKVKVDSNPPNPNVVSYRDTEGEASLYWDLHPRTRLSGGLYSDTYETDNRSNKTTGQGIRFQASHDWTPTYNGVLSANVERTKADFLDNTLDDSATSWAINFGVVRKEATSALRLDGGRTFSPSNGGTRTAYDQLRVQYYLQFKPKWSYVVAARTFRSREQGAGIGNNNRDYSTAFMQLNRELTRTWYLTGNVSFTTQKYASGGGSATDNALTLGVGYKGLQPQR